MCSNGSSKPKRVQAATRRRVTNSKSNHSSSNSALSRQNPQRAAATADTENSIVSNIELNTSNANLSKLNKDLREAQDNFKTIDQKPNSAMFAEATDNSNLIHTERSLDESGKFTLRGECSQNNSVVVDLLKHGGGANYHFDSSIYHVQEAEAL